MKEFFLIIFSFSCLINFSQDTITCTTDSNQYFHVSTNEHFWELDILYIKEDGNFLLITNDSAFYYLEISKNQKVIKYTCNWLDYKVTGEFLNNKKNGPWAVSQNRILKWEHFHYNNDTIFNYYHFNQKKNCIYLNNKCVQKCSKKPLKRIKKIAKKNDLRISSYFVGVHHSKKGLVYDIELKYINPNDSTIDFSFSIILTPKHHNINYPSSYGLITKFIGENKKYKVWINHEEKDKQKIKPIIQNVQENLIGKI